MFARRFHLFGCTPGAPRPARTADLFRRINQRDCWCRLHTMNCQSLVGSMFLCENRPLWYRVAFFWHQWKQSIVRLYRYSTRINTSSTLLMRPRLANLQWILRNYFWHPAWGFYLCCFYSFLFRLLIIRCTTRVVVPVNEARGFGRGRSILRRLRGELPPGTLVDQIISTRLATFLLKLLYQNSSWSSVSYAIHVLEMVIMQYCCMIS